jgi:general secretion pathway protein G
MKTLGSSKTKTARIQLEDLSAALDIYRLEVGRYPTTNDGLQALVENTAGTPNWNGPYLKKNQVPNDPWGFDYGYRSPGEHGSFDIWSLGADNRDGGEGENQDILGWQ